MSDPLSTERDETWRKERMYGELDTVLWAIVKDTDEGLVVVGSMLREEDADAVIASEAERTRLETALRTISDIRDRIVGSQTVNWSRDIYPLVAALGEAGFVGRPYEECKAHIEYEMEQAKANRVYKSLPFP